MGEWHTFNEKPESGRRIVAIFDDGSGAHLFYVHDDGFVDEDGEDSPVGLESSYSHWAYLPRGVQLWCELRANDPMKFPEKEPTP